jgi:cytochrome b561
MPGKRIDRYGAIAQSFHWLTAVLVLAAFTLGPGGSEERVYAAARDADRQLHESLGLAVFVLVILRLAWRALDEHPDPPLVPRWMGLVAKLLQAMLYVLLLAVPLTAVTGAWLEGHPLTLLAGLRVAPLLPDAHGPGAAMAELHGWLGDALLWLAGFHAVAALHHHFLLKDGVLVSMLPRWMARPRPAEPPPFERR